MIDVSMHKADKAKIELSVHEGNDRRGPFSTVRLKPDNGVSVTLFFKDQTMARRVAEAFKPTEENANG